MAEEGRLRDFYEVLGVEEDATEDVIKRAYKRKALMCHPDKNGHRQEAAARDFKELSNAYTTLLDKNERAWYDAHKEQILSGRTHDDDYEPNSMDLFPYFSPNAFNGFDMDNKKSFYNVFEKVFKTLSSEEIPFLDKKEKASWNPPSIGNPSTPIEEVNSFYDFWKSHQTNKNFSWKDKYNPNDAENRQIRRAIEKENKKERSAARREYNETLRNLVNHVRKNDKRVKEHRIKQAQKQEEERLLKEAHQKKVVEERKRTYEESKASWWEEFENEFDFDENADTLQAVMEAGMTEKEKRKLRKKDEEKEPDNFYCKVCKKVFRSKPKLTEHKATKKHLQNWKKLGHLYPETESESESESEEEEEEEEEESESESESGVLDSGSSPKEVEGEKDEVDSKEASSQKDDGSSEGSDSESEEHKKEQPAASESSEDESSEEEIQIVDFSKMGRLSKKDRKKQAASRKQQPTPAHYDPEEEELGSFVQKGSPTGRQSKKDRNRNKRQPQKKEEEEEQNESEDEAEVPQIQKGGRKNKKGRRNQKNFGDSDDDMIDPVLLQKGRKTTTVSDDEGSRRNKPTKRQLARERQERQKQEEERLAKEKLEKAQKAKELKKEKDLKRRELWEAEQRNLEKKKFGEQKYGNKEQDSDEGDEVGIAGSDSDDDSAPPQPAPSKPLPPTEDEDVADKPQPAEEPKSESESEEQPQEELTYEDYEAKKKQRERNARAAKKGDPSASLVCGVCFEAFSSRNKLFQHIQKTGHAQFKTEASCGKKKGKKGKG